MHLSDLVAGDPDFQVENADETVAITGLTEDSRVVQPGTLFAAIKGTKTDGSQFIGDAVGKGAVAVLVELDVAIEQEVAIIRHPNPRAALGIIAARFYNKQPEMIAAVTGTNGKTSVAHFCRQLWHFVELSSASMGTIGIIKGEGKEAEDNNSLTTPDTIFLHESLKQLAEEGVSHLALEASSHGLAQLRLAGVNISIGAFTNLSRDHMDYHANFEDYLQAKLKLFTEVLPEGSTAVVNADSNEYEKVRAACETRGHTIISFGEKGEDLVLKSAVPSATGQEITCVINGEEHSFTLDLIGSFQASNILCALGMVLASSANAASAIAAIPKLTAVPGRMEKVADHPSGASIIVDYAHTPAALEAALSALRPHTQGKLHLVVGCGGDRDQGKRPEMGKIAQELADTIIITDDNPRTEDPAAIRQEILAACPNATEIAPREEAIQQAISQLATGDILLIAGKGHEKVQLIGDKSCPFDDAAIACEAVEKQEYSNA